MRLADAYDEKICVTEIDHARLDDTRRGTFIFHTVVIFFFFVDNKDKAEI